MFEVKVERDITANRRQRLAGKRALLPIEELLPGCSFYFIEALIKQLKRLVLAEQGYCGLRSHTFDSRYVVGRITAKRLVINHLLRPDAQLLKNFLTSICNYATVSARHEHLNIVIEKLEGILISS